MWQLKGFLSLISFGLNDPAIEGNGADWGLYVYCDPSGLRFYPQLVKRSGLWHMWVKVKADPETAAQFKCTVIVVKKVGVDTEKVIEHISCKVHPVDETVEKIIISGDTLVMTTGNVINMKTKLIGNRDGQLFTSFSVMRKDE